MAIANHDGVELYYETFGDRADPALLLVNGLGSQSISYRDALCARFVDRGLFVIRFDNRDVGLSTKFDDHVPRVAEATAAVREGREPEVAYRLSDMAADAVAVLDAAGVDRAHVLGVSMGGMIAQQVAIDHPGRVRSLISIMSTTGDPDVGHPTPEARAVLFGAPATDRDGAVAAALTGARVFGSPGLYDEADVAEFAAAAYDRCFNPRGVARQIEAIVAGGSRSAALARLNLPTLVIHGDHDTLIDVSGGARTAEVIPGARLEVVEGMGHDYPPALWDRLVGLIGDFVLGVPAP